MIELRGIRKLFGRGGREVCAVDGVDLTIAAHSIVALIGPSGCGKSTLLNMTAGLYKPSGGQIHYDGHLVTDVNTDVGYMTQKDNLLPWRHVLDNVALPLELAGHPRDERYAAAGRLLKQVGLDGFETKFPSELSGGMRKRVALARMLLYEPRTLLLDEPFAALDAQLRIAMHDLLLRLWGERRQTIVLVTHDLMEAITLADRVVVFTRRPARVALCQDIPLSRPRDVQEIRFTPEFHDIYSALWERLREEYDEGRL
ncbi:ABC transporter ATP-binding protein [Methylobacterium mesophilicum SR1.6/6]|uniref:ABC transporter ATP-binding protein n=1 Tax=Methylobacterium mesophilicum SR1.6/6 TaxID=908290 RepID=A0A6B9FEY7_9HYPH|nr:ABC transporter ATP-binding protein [Methylobacterium mesophilicum]QGY01571.1 ABC transporter ATP-binding protein [Methylobacterium mesophilicum SR1.6/6]